MSYEPVRCPKCGLAMALAIRESFPMVYDAGRWPYAGCRACPNGCELMGYHLLEWVEDHG